MAHGVLNPSFFQRLLPTHECCKLCFTQGFSGLAPGAKVRSSSCESALGPGSFQAEPKGLALVAFLSHAIFHIFFQILWGCGEGCVHMSVGVMGMGRGFKIPWSLCYGNL